MPIDMQAYKTVRQLYLKERRSIRYIAKILHMSRKTVRKYCKGGALPDVRDGSGRPSLLRDLVEPEIIRLLEENKNLPHKQQLNATDIWKYLVSEKGIAIAQSTALQFVRELRNKTPEIFIELSHEPGETIQFDWGDMVAVISGTKTVVSVFCAALPFSGYIHGFPYPNKNMLSFLDGHIKTFEHIGAVSHQCVYDNLRTAVKKGSGKNAEKQEEFIRMEAHYGFEPVFCNIASGWEKSSVENAVAIIRRIAFTPMPHVESFAELQKHITNRCLQYARTHIIKGRQKTIWELFQEERPEMMPLPEVALDTGFTTTALVHPDLTVHYQGIKYSVPKTLAGKEVTLRISPFHVSVFYHGELAYKHERPLKKQEHQYVLEHYLDILERNPRAVNQAKVLKQGIMPKECSEFLRLCREQDAKQQLVEILLLGREVEKEKLLWAISQANNTKSPSLNVVRMFLDLKESPGTIDDLVVEHKGLEIYDSLILKGGDGHGNVTQ